MVVIEGYLYLFAIPNPLISGSNSFDLFFGITMVLTSYDDDDCWVVPFCWSVYCSVIVVIHSWR
jgi:hypothetical protein